MKKIALITGASSGIGRATAKAFTEKGYNLILCGRREEHLQSLVDWIGDRVNTKILLFDISDNNQVKNAFNCLSDEWLNIDILINNAGNAHGYGPIEDGDPKDWDLMMDINVKGLLYMSKVVIERMLKRQKGHIVNISSIAGKQVYVNGVVYCASKSAVETISEGMRLELTEKGIKITNIAPGAVETEFSEVRFKGDSKRARQVYEGFTPLHPRDVADAIVYAVTAPEHVTIADLTILPSAQASSSQIYRKIKE